MLSENTTQIYTDIDLPKLFLQYDSCIANLGQCGQPVILINVNTIIANDIQRRIFMYHSKTLVITILIRLREMLARNCAYVFDTIDYKTASSTELDLHEPSYKIEGDRVKSSGVARAQSSAYPTANVV